MEAFLQKLAAFAPGGAFDATMEALSPWLYVLGVLIVVAEIYVGRRYEVLHLTDARSGTDSTMGLLIGAVLGALTGLLWFTWNPIKIVPPYIHLRLFSFFPAIVGILFGRGAGFLSGWVATMVWAPLAGAFVPLHSPIFDGIFVGLTGWIPAAVIRGGKSNAELLEDIKKNATAWYLKTAVVCLSAGLFMSFFVAVSLELTTPLTFWTAFWAIGIVSDTGPLLLFTAPAAHALLLATKRAWNWMPSF